MPTGETTQTSWHQRHDVIFSIFLMVFAFLWRDNPHLVYPDVLYMLVALMGLNLAAGWALRLMPGRPWVAAVITLGNCGVITAILAHSGGPESNFWPLYLLPIYTACVLFDSGTVGLVTVGAVGFNGAYHLFYQEAPDDTGLLFFALKSAVLIFAAATTSRIAQRQRRTLDEAQAQRVRLDELEEALTGSERRIERSQALAEVGMVTSGVAHDLKSPLLVIMGTADLMLDNGCSEETKHDIRRIRRSAELCRDIVTGILDQARHRAFDPRPCHVGRLIWTAVDLYKNTLDSAGITARVHLEKGLPPVRGAALELQRVLMNLLSNAKDATPRGGSVTVGARPAEGGVEIWVKDTGPGIPDDRMGKLFQAFATTKAAKGTGLGLYLCREIAMRHAGYLRAENAPEGGARFRLFLPAAKEPRSDGSPAFRERAAGKGRSPAQTNPARTPEDAGTARTPLPQAGTHKDPQGSPFPPEGTGALKTRTAPSGKEG